MYWPLLNMYSENFGFGLGFFIISRTFNHRMKGLYEYAHTHTRFGLASFVDDADFTGYLEAWLCCFWGGHDMGNYIHVDGQ